MGWHDNGKNAIWNVDLWKDGFYDLRWILAMDWRWVNQLTEDFEVRWSDELVLRFLMPTEICWGYEADMTWKWMHAIFNLI